MKIAGDNGRDLTCVEATFRISLGYAYAKLSAFSNLILSLGRCSVLDYQEIADSQCISIEAPRGLNPVREELNVYIEHVKQCVLNHKAEMHMS